MLYNRGTEVFFPTLPFSSSFKQIFIEPPDTMLRSKEMLISKSDVLFAHRDTITNWREHSKETVIQTEAQPHCNRRCRRKRQVRVYFRRIEPVTKVWEYYCEKVKIELKSER